MFIGSGIVGRGHFFAVGDREDGFANTPDPNMTPNGLIFIHFSGDTVTKGFRTPGQQYNEIGTDYLVVSLANRNHFESPSFRSIKIILQEQNYSVNAVIEIIFLFAWIHNDNRS